MGFLGGLLGTKNKFQADQADIYNPVDRSQVNDAAGQTSNALGQQQKFVNALGAQNGLDNQARVFNQQQALANQLGLQAQGQGPNPALAQLNQTTGQNIANQAALMAGQRGAGANAGLIARQAAQQGGNLQQQAVGQGAILQAQQQLAAQQALQNQQANMAGLANTQVGQQQAGLNAYNQAAQGMQSNLLGAQGNFNNASIQNNQGTNSINAGVAQGNQQANAGLAGGIIGGASSAIGHFLAHGGEVPSYAEGGDVSGPQSSYGKALTSFGDAFSKSMQNLPLSPMQQNLQTAAGGGYGLSQVGNGLGSLAVNGLAQAFKPKPFVQMAGSPADVVVAPASPMVMGGAPQVMNASEGGKIPGKAKVKGDSYANDTVPAVLSPGEVVIPRHVMQSDDPVKGAAAFVASVMAKKRAKK